MGGGLIINICEYSILLTYMYFWMSGGGGFTTGVGRSHPPNGQGGGGKIFIYLFFLKQIIF